MRKGKNLKEMLVRLRDLTDLMVELGYAAILQDDRELAQEAQRLRDEIREVAYNMRVLTIFAAKGLPRKDVEQLSSLLQIGVAVKEISDGIDDMVEIVSRGVHPIVQAAYRRDFIMKVMDVEEECPVDGKSLEKARIPEETGFFIRAIRRGDDWIFYPNSKTVLKKRGQDFPQGKGCCNKEDTILCQKNGEKEKVRLLRKF
ncbi:MAG TPA: hypothetical protein ENF18_03595 [candidate division WOR-3 bacterium]|uniref:RCK C-terminal domain-containing protein n=1 Tax=candidate division WOR-3 bacterium TaxID=2052148 RepID=A0A7C0Z9H5_UNCW3|nr:hypothetical protein [candidate division WOR-3 bacterium]